MADSAVGPSRAADGARPATGSGGPGEAHEHGTQSSTNLATDIPVIWPAVEIVCHAPDPTVVWLTPADLMPDKHPEG